MATLADVLRQTGYSQDGTLAAPATDSPMTKALSEHIKTLPQQLATNQAALDSAIASWNKTDFGTGLPNPNYRPEAIAELTQLMPNIGGLTAWHGTPHKIQGAFDISKVGTGEGAQAYGHGMYFAENPKVAEAYKTQQIPAANLNAASGKSFDSIEDFFNEVKPKGVGNLYKVDIPDEYIPNMLDWDKPLNQQPKAVQDALAKIDPDLYHPTGGDYEPTELGQTIYHRLQNVSGKQSALFKQRDELLNKYMTDNKSMSEAVKSMPADDRVKFSEIAQQIDNLKNSPQEASKLLNESGITGIRYLDAGSRGKEGTSNFVVFDPSTVKILEENGKTLTRKELIEKQVKDLKD